MLSNLSENKYRDRDEITISVRTHELDWFSKICITYNRKVPQLIFFIGYEYVGELASVHGPWLCNLIVKHMYFNVNTIIYIHEV